MQISRELYDEMVAHALADAPDECCGIVSSRDNVAVELFRMENVFHTPFKYGMDPMELYRVVTGIEDAGLDVGIIYHSHTRSEPYPSQTDINLAFYPDSLYVIVGTAAEPQPKVRAFTIRDERVEEVELTVV
jgi:[CysO sulfur-carrier protein]-S-L-cysteine hydrolase